MWPQFLRGFANTLIVSYAADGLVSLLHIASRLSILGDLRGALATFVVLQCVLALPLLGLTKKLPLSVFLPIVASTLWFTSGAMPLGFPLEANALEWGLVFGQIAIGGYAIWRVWWLRERRGWLFDESWFSGRLFSFPYFALYELGASLAFAAFLVSIVLTTLANGLESATNGFVRFDAAGVSLADRHYENAGRSIRLIGMMHIGEEAGYRTLFQDLGKAGADTLVLTEGVSDSEGVLTSGLSYAPLADFLGVEEQRAIEDYVDSSDAAGDGRAGGPTFMNADVDLADFDPRTIAWLGEVTSIYSEGGALLRIFEVYREMQRNPATAAVILEDIVDRRNQVLIAHIDEHRSSYEELVVPWGALHLPGIEAAIEKRGFRRQSTAYVPIISWRRLGSVLTTSTTASTHADPAPIDAIRAEPGA